MFDDFGEKEIADQSKRMTAQPTYLPDFIR